ncbi:MAG: hypothetical protein Q8Q09_21265 [Deltaproteobacteria bacterium]|nr:hypothetical protein [Deltaproteobacteria bacterium]
MPSLCDRLSVAQCCLAAVLSFSGGCVRDVPVDLRVLVPDAGMLLSGPAAATAVIRVGLEGDPRSVRDTTLGAMGTFAAELRPTDPRSIARLRVDILHGTTLMAQGSSPAIAWLAIGGQRLSVFVQPTDTVQPAPSGPLRTPRADFVFLSSGGSGAVAFTLPNGAPDAVPEQYFLPTHQTRSYTFSLPAVFDGETSVVPLPLGRGILLLRGERALVTNDSSPGAAPNAPIPAARRLLRGAGVIQDTDASYVLGGRAEDGTRSARIDGVSELGDVIEIPETLAVARARPAAIVLRPRAGTTPPMYLIAGGQDPMCATCASLEQWVPGQTARAIDPGSPELSRRSEFAALCVQRSAAGLCDRVLILGGRDGVTQGLAPRDLLLDGECLRVGSGSCVLRELDALLTRRMSPRVALGSDGARVVVTGGRDADNRPVYSLEILDVSDPAMVTRVEGTRELTVADPALASLSDGSVLIGGGIDRDTQRPSAALSLVRGPIAPLPVPIAMR